MRSPHNSGGLPIDTQTSVCRKSQPFTAVSISSVMVRRAPVSRAMICAASMRSGSGQLSHFLLCKAAILNAIVQTPQETRRILHTLFIPDVRAGRTNIGHVRPLLTSRHLERRAGTRRIFLKNQCYLLPFQALHLGPCVPGCLQLSRELQQEADLLWCEVVQLQKMSISQIESHVLPLHNNENTRLLYWLNA